MRSLKPLKSIAGGLFHIESWANECYILSYRVEKVLSMLIMFDPIFYAKAGARHRNVRETTYLLYISKTNSLERLNCAHVEIP